MVVFMTRYFDLFMYMISIYNTCMKILFLSLTAYVIYLIKYVSWR